MIGIGAEFKHIRAQLVRASEGRHLPCTPPASRHVEKASGIVSILAFINRDKERGIADADSAEIISNERFVRQLREVQDLKQFLFEEKVKFEPTQLGAIDLGSLNNLRFGSKGRQPTSDEWKLLDEKISLLSTYLNDELRQKIRIRELSVFFGVIPLSFLVASLAILLFRFSYGAFLEKDTLSFNLAYLSSIIVWTVAQGGLGACAFLGTKVATKHLEKAQLDTLGDVADVTDKSILKIRIILGCLFGSLIGIPFATVALDKIGDVFYPVAGAKATLSVSDFGLVILPFMVGFSTNLVLAILERCIDSIRTFFGIGVK